jgi:hypothetical protein
MSSQPKIGPQNFYCRLRGASQGRKIRALDRNTARRMFAAQEGISVASPYITLCYKPTKGVVYAN